MNFENIKLNYLFQTFSLFKESEINTINNLLPHTRCGVHLTFDGYGNASFEDVNRKEFMNVNKLNSFERKNTNLIIYKVVTPELANIYTHIFVYHNLSAALNSYGLICYNENTNICSHKIQIVDEVGELILSINQAIMSMTNPDPFKNLNELGVLPKAKIRRVDMSEFMKKD